MNKRARLLPKSVTRAAAGIAAGLTLGFAVGWWFWPVQYTNTAPDVLRQDYHDDYVAMVAAAYEVEQDLEQAREWLKLLDPEEPSTPVIELAERLVETGGSAEDVTRLTRLARALGADSPTLIPYMEDRP